MVHKVFTRLSGSSRQYDLIVTFVAAQVSSFLNHAMSSSLAIALLAALAQKIIVAIDFMILLR
jgi:hypothetical protein